MKLMKQEPQTSVVKSSSIPALLSQKSTMVRVAAGAGAVGVLALGLPMIGSALMGALGLLGLGLTALVGIGAFMALPLLGQKWENRILASQKKEARENPIEQLDNNYIAREQKFQSAVSFVEKMGTSLKSMGRKIEERKKTNPGQDLSAVEQPYRALKESYEFAKAELAKAQEALARYKEFVDQKRWEYEISLDASAALSGLKGAKQEDATKGILTDESVREIERTFDGVFSNIEMQNVLNGSKNINDHGTVIDATFEPVQGGR